MEALARSLGIKNIPSLLAQRILAQKLRIEERLLRSTGPDQFNCIAQMISAKPRFWLVIRIHLAVRPARLRPFNRLVRLVRINSSFGLAWSRQVQCGPDQFNLLVRTFTLLVRPMDLLARTITF